MRKFYRVAVWFVIICIWLTKCVKAEDLDLKKSHHISIMELHELNPQNYDVVKCQFDGKYVIYIQVRPDWAQLGAERYLELVRDKYYDNIALFRAVDDFLIQFGLANTDEKRQKWMRKTIKDDPSNNIPFTKGMLSFAGSGKHSRETQIFFVLGQDLSWHLGKSPWEVPFAQIIYGVNNLDFINTEYEEKVDQQKIWSLGYDYLKKDFPNLSYIDYCYIVDTQKKEL
eukprot:302960_1